MNDNVLVVATYAEARELGSRHRFGVLVDDATGDRIVSVSAGPRAVEGMRVSEVRWTERALEHPNARKLDQVLRRCQLKSGHERS